MFELKSLILFILIILISVGGLIYILIRIDAYSCGQLEKNTAIETKYVWIGGGCLVKVNNRYIPKGNWRGEYQQ